MSQPDLCGSAAEFVFLLFSGHEALAGIIYLLLLHYIYRMYHEFIYSPSLHYTSEYECEPASRVWVMRQAPGWPERSVTLGVQPGRGGGHEPSAFPHVGE